MWKNFGQHFASLSKMSMEFFADILLLPFSCRQKFLSTSYWHSKMSAENSTDMLWTEAKCGWKQNVGTSDVIPTKINIKLTDILRFLQKSLRRLKLFCENYQFELKIVPNHQNEKKNFTISVKLFYNSTYNSIFHIPYSTVEKLLLRWAGTS